MSQFTTRFTSLCFGGLTKYFTSLSGTFWLLTVMTGNVGSSTKSTKPTYTLV